MKESAWGYLIILLGVSIIAIMLLIQNLTTTSEENFYLTREVLEASMYDAVDYGTYAKSGKLVMSEQKFVEVFLRRFSESVTNNRTYNINFYDIHEYPPKATVLITTDTGETTVSSDTVNINVNTYLNAILETVSVYNEKMIISKLTETYTKDGVLVESLKCGEEVITNFQFLADNDPCGLYKNIGTDDAGNEKIIFSRNAGSDKTEEYCNVRIETEGLQGQKNIREYIVRKSSLVKPEDWNDLATPAYTNRYCNISN
ncbi:MAG: DUF5411 family protein [bacterium]|nr:DUF5411 family protein [bacterium]